MRNNIIKFRCSESERERIEGMSREAGVPLSEYCRQVCMNGRILATRRLTPEEISYFRALKEHNNGFARLANLIRSWSPDLVIAIKEYLEQSKRLYNRFF